MDLLQAGLAPFVERETQAAVKVGTVRMDAVRRFAEDPMLGSKPIARRRETRKAARQFSVWTSSQAGAARTARTRATARRTPRRR